MVEGEGQKESTTTQGPHGDLTGSSLGYADYELLYCKVVCDYARNICVFVICRFVVVYVDVCGWVWLWD